MERQYGGTVRAPHSTFQSGVGTYSQTVHAPVRPLASVRELATPGEQFYGSPTPGMRQTSQPSTASSCVMPMVRAINQPPAAGMWPLSFSVGSQHRAVWPMSSADGSSSMRQHVVHVSQQLNRLESPAATGLIGGSQRVLESMQSSPYAGFKPQPPTAMTPVMSDNNQRPPSQQWSTTPLPNITGTASVASAGCSHNGDRWQGVPSSSKQSTESVSRDGYQPSALRSCLSSGTQRQQAGFYPSTETLSLTTKSTGSLSSGASDVGGKLAADKRTLFMEADSKQMNSVARKSNRFSPFNSSHKQRVLPPSGIGDGGNFFRRVGSHGEPVSSVSAVPNGQNPSLISESAPEAPASSVSREKEVMSCSRDIPGHVAFGGSNRWNDAALLDLTGRSTDVLDLSIKARSYDSVNVSRPCSVTPRLQPPSRPPSLLPRCESVPILSPRSCSSPVNRAVVFNQSASVSKDSFAPHLRPHSEVIRQEADSNSWYSKSSKSADHEDMIPFIDDAVSLQEILQRELNVAALRSPQDLAQLFPNMTSVNVSPDKTAGTWLEPASSMSRTSAPVSFQSKFSSRQESTIPPGVCKIGSPVAQSSPYAVQRCSAGLSFDTQKANVFGQNSSPLIPANNIYKPTPVSRDESRGKDHVAAAHDASSNSTSPTMVQSRNECNSVLFTVEQQRTLQFQMNNYQRQIGHNCSQGAGVSPINVAQPPSVSSAAHVSVRENVSASSSNIPVQKPWIHSTASSSNSLVNTVSSESRALSASSTAVSFGQTTWVSSPLNKYDFHHGCNDPSVALKIPHHSAADSYNPTSSVMSLTLATSSTTESLPICCRASLVHPFSDVDNTSSTEQQKQPTTSRSPRNSAATASCGAISKTGDVFGDDWDDGDWNSMCASLATNVVTHKRLAESKHTVHHVINQTRDNHSACCDDIAPAETSTVPPPVVCTSVCSSVAATPSTVNSAPSSLASTETAVKLESMVNVKCEPETDSHCLPDSSLSPPTAQIKTDSPNDKCAPQVSSDELATNSALTDCASSNSSPETTNSMDHQPLAVRLRVRRCQRANRFTRRLRRLRNRSGDSLKKRRRKLSETLPDSQPRSLPPSLNSPAVPGTESRVQSNPTSVITQHPRKRANVHFPKHPCSNMDRRPLNETMITAALTAVETEPRVPPLHLPCVYLPSVLDDIRCLSEVSDDILSHYSREYSDLLHRAAELTRRQLNMTRWRRRMINSSSSGGCCALLSRWSAGWTKECRQWKTSHCRLPNCLAKVPPPLVPSRLVAAVSSSHQTVQPVKSATPTDIPSRVTSTLCDKMTIPATPESLANSNQMASSDRCSADLPHSECWQDRKQSTVLDPVAAAVCRLPAEPQVLSCDCSTANASEKISMADLPVSCRQLFDSACSSSNTTAESGSKPSRIATSWTDWRHRHIYHCRLKYIERLLMDSVRHSLSDDRQSSVSDQRGQLLLTDDSDTSSTCDKPLARALISRYSQLRASGAPSSVSPPACRTAVVSPHCASSHVGDAGITAVHLLDTPRIKTELVPFRHEALHRFPHELAQTPLTDRESCASSSEESFNNDPSISEDILTLVFGDKSYKPVCPPVYSHETAAVLPSSPDPDSSTVVPVAAPRARRRRGRFRSGLDYMIKRKRRRPPAVQMSSSADSTPLKQRRFNCQGIDGRVGGRVNENGKADVSAEIRSWMLNKSAGETAILRATKMGHQEALLYLLNEDSSGELVNTADNANFSPLHEACARGYVGVARLLLMYGADVNVSSPGGVRPLHEAAENGNVEMVRLLLSYGAEPRLRTYAGSSALQLSAHCPPVHMLLRGHLYDIDGGSDSDICEAVGGNRARRSSISGDSECVADWSIVPLASKEPMDSGLCILDTQQAAVPDTDDTTLTFDLSTLPLPAIYTAVGATNDPGVVGCRYIALSDLAAYLQVSDGERLLQMRPELVSVTRQFTSTDQATLVCHTVGGLDRVSTDTLWVRLTRDVEMLMTRERFNMTR